MSRMRYLVVFVGLAMVVPEAVMAQVRSTLDTQFPSDHEYVVAVWYSKNDKAGTFKYAIMDPSIPGNYNRRQWEDSKLAWNDPNKGTMMNIFPVRTSQYSRQTERQQVMARVEQEKKRIDWIEKPTLDVMELAESLTKKDSGKTTFSYDESAKKSSEVGKLAGTTWVLGGSTVRLLGSPSQNRGTLDAGMFMRGGTWGVNGTSFEAVIRAGTPGMETHFKGRLNGEQMEGQTWDTGSPVAGGDYQYKPFSGYRRKEGEGQR